MANPAEPSMSEQTLRDLHDARCVACGGEKKPPAGFCSHCYGLLPEHLKAGLTHGCPGVYDAAHAEARAWLAGRKER